MPADPPIVRPPEPSGPREPRFPESAPGPAGVGSVIAGLHADLDRARAEYALRRTAPATALLDDVKRRIATLPDTGPAAPPELRLIEASLHTLRGRLVSRTDWSAASALFRRAVDLFDAYASTAVGQPVQTRVLTDYGIALYRISWRVGDRMADAIRVLRDVCRSGSAPPEALGYLGYAQLEAGDFGAAERSLRKGLELSSADPTMLYWLARVLEASARKAGVIDEAEKARIVDAYCTAARAAGHVKDYPSTARCGMRGLRIEHSSEDALALAVLAYGRCKRSGLANAVLERFLEGHPSNPQALGLKGMFLREHGRPAEAIEVLRPIQATSPDLAWVRLELARAFLAAGPARANEALAATEDVLRSYPDNPIALRCKAWAHIGIGAYPEAVAALRPAAASDPSPEILGELGYALFMAGDFAAARDEFDRAVRADPRSARAHWWLAASLNRLGDHERAAASYQRAARLEPDDPDIFNAFIGTLRQNGRLDEAMEEIDDRVSGRLCPLALWWKGRLYIDRQDWHHALEALEAAAQAGAAAQTAGETDAGSDCPRILVDLGDVYRKVGQYSRACDAYGRALAMPDQRVDVLAAAALYYCDVAEYELALGHLESGITLDREKAYLWDLRGWCHLHLGDANAAREAYERAFDLTNSKDPWYRKGLANALFHLDRVEEAKEHFEAILDEQKYRPGPEPINERPSGNASTVGLLGWCQYRLRRYDDAIRLFQTALSDASDDLIPLRFDLGLTLLASGRTQLAEDAYTQATLATERCELERRRGLYYVALFDLADARRRKVVEPGTGKIFEQVEKKLASSGIPLSGLKWLPERELAEH